MCLSVNETVLSHETTDDCLEARPKQKSSLSKSRRKEKVFVSDSIAMSTQCARQIFQFINARDKKFKKSEFFKWVASVQLEKSRPLRANTFLKQFLGIFFRAKSFLN